MLVLIAAIAMHFRFNFRPRSPRRLHLPVTMNVQIRTRRCVGVLERTCCAWPYNGPCHTVASQTHFRFNFRLPLHVPDSAAETEPGMHADFPSFEDNMGVWLPTTQQRVPRSVLAHRARATQVRIISCYSIAARIPPGRAGNDRANMLYFWVCFCFFLLTQGP